VIPNPFSPDLFSHGEHGVARRKSIIIIRDPLCTPWIERGIADWTGVFRGKELCHYSHGRTFSFYSCQRRGLKNFISRINSSLFPFLF
jgi:hypothetical protein